MDFFILQKVKKLLSIGTSFGVIFREEPCKGRHYFFIFFVDQIDENIYKEEQDDRQNYFLYFWARILARFCFENFIQGIFLLYLHAHGFAQYWIGHIDQDEVDILLVPIQ